MFSANKEKIGWIGEAEVRNQLTIRNHKVISSLDFFDSQGDIFCDGQRIEIKSTQPMYTTDVWGVRPSQERKMRNVAENYIVSVPPVARPDYRYGGKIYRVSPDFQSTYYTTRNGTRMMGIPIRQPAVVEFCKISPEAMYQFNKYSESGYA